MKRTHGICAVSCLTIVVFLALEAKADQVSLVASENCWIQKTEADSTHYNQNYIQGGCDSAQWLGAGLIKFDLSQLKKGYTIVSAYFTCASGWWGTNTWRTSEFHECITDWNETNATWNNFGDGTGGVAGVDYDATALFTVEALSAYSYVFSNDVTSLVQGWVEDSASNNGFFLKAVPTRDGIPGAGDWSGAFIISRTCPGQEAGLPQLVITYEVPEPITFSLLMFGGMAIIARKRF